MKKIINVKEVMMILVSIVVITSATNVFAIDAVLGTNTTADVITPDQYQNVQNIETNNTSINNTSNNTNSGNNAVINNTSVNNSSKTNNTTNLPQTGIEDYNIGILMVICIASAIYTFKKVQEYKNI